MKSVTCRRVGIVGVISSAVATASCSPETSVFSPLGHDAQVYGEWDVNGLVPDASICTRASIERVVIEWTDSNDVERFRDPSFEMPCSDGFYDSPAPVLAAGTYGYRWIALSGDAVVLESQRYVANVQPGIEVVLQAVNFVRRVGVEIDVSLALQTDVGFGDCSAASAEQLNWELRLGSSTGALVATSNGDIACTTSLVVPDLPSGALVDGDYVLTVRASAMDGALWASDCPVHVFESGPTSITCDVSRLP